jgi:hypothetical protein
MDRRWQTIIGGKEESAYQRLTVEKFMTNMGLAWETVRKYSDLVFIFKKRADSADSSQANPRAEGGPGLDSRQPETGHHRQGEILRAA